MLNKHPKHQPSGYCNHSLHNRLNHNVINTEVIKGLRPREPRKAERNHRYQTEYKVTDVIGIMSFDLLFLH